MDRHISLYRQYLNLHDATFTLIEHEDAAVATVYKVSLPNGTNLILKVCSLPRHYARELYFLKHLSGKIPVPHIIDHVPPQDSINGALLMEWLPGDVLKKEDLTETHAFSLGALLAKIHLNRTAGYGDLTKPDSLNSHPSKAFIKKFEHHLAESSSHISSRLIQQCEEYLQNHLMLLNAVDGPCMVHWDFRPGNIMVHQGIIQGVIDWSSSRSDFAEEDFCSLEHYGWAHNPSIKSSFLAGYSDIRPVPDYHEIMPLLRLSKALGGLGFTIRTHTWTGKNKAFYRMNKQFIEDLW